MKRLSLFATAALAVAATARVATAVPGDPTDGQNPLDDLVRPLAELNLRPDFNLTAGQKADVLAIRNLYAARLAAWRAAHADDFRRQEQEWNDLRNGRGGPPGGRPTERWSQLREGRQRLLLGSPDPTDALTQIDAVLTGDQRRRFDAADPHPAPARAPATSAAFAADVLPLPADGIPRSPGFYKLRVTADVPAEEGPGRQRMRMTYVLFLPHDYEASKGPYPALVFLHGSGEVGTDGNAIFAGGLGPAAELRGRAGTPFAADFPMILVCPQCPPRGERWDQTPVLQAALQVLDDAQRKVKIDPDRVYVTGLSMGGKGTWLLAGQAPDRFAAIAPLAASTLDLPLARKLKDLSIWTVNGSEDIEDGATNEPQMAAAATAAGGDARATILDGEGHGIWYHYYSDPAFYQWMLKHHRLTAAERAARVPPPTTQPTTQAMR